MKKIILLICLVIVALPSLAASKEVFFLSKLINQNLNQSNPKSLINLVAKLNREASKVNRKNKKMFLNQASQIYVRQKKSILGIRKLTNTSKSHKKINDLLSKIKSLNYSSRSSRSTNAEIINKQIEINNQIQNIMSDLEDELENAKEDLLSEPANSGVFGISEEITGDCMPQIGNTRSSCTRISKSMTITVRKPASIDNFDSSGALEIKPELIKQISSDENGFFEINLDPGIYSILVLDRDREVCNSAFSSDGLACTIEIENGTKTFYKLILDNAFW